MNDFYFIFLCTFSVSGGPNSGVAEIISRLAAGKSGIVCVCKSDAVSDINDLILTVK